MDIKTTYRLVDLGELLHQRNNDEMSHGSNVMFQSLPLVHEVQHGTDLLHHVERIESISKQGEHRAELLVSISLHTKSCQKTQQLVTTRRHGREKHVVCHLCVLLGTQRSTRGHLVRVGGNAK